MIKPDVLLGNTLNYLTPFSYSVDSRGELSQDFIPADETAYLLAIMNSLVLNYFARNKVSAHVNIHQLYELPVPKLAGKLRARLAAAAEKLMASPHDPKERARLEVVVARDAYGLDAADWEHLTGTFTYGSGDSKAELDETIAHSRELW
jgi:hypothetical protein